MNPILSSEIIDENPQEFSLKTYETNKKKKECPRCDGNNIFIIDKNKKSFWCRDCCCGFGKRKADY